MAFTLVNITNISGTMGTGFTPLRPQIARDSTSRIWAAYFDVLGNIFCRFSDDLGVTWSLQETVINFGFFGPPVSAIIMTVDSFDQPGLCYVYGGTAYFYLRIAGVWSFQSSTAVPTDDNGMALMADAFGRWHFIYVHTVANIDTAVHLVSDDEMGTWAAHATIAFGDNTGLEAMAQKASSAAVMDSAGDIYLVGGGADIAGGGNHAVMYAHYNHGLDNWDLLETAWITGPNPADKPVSCSISIGPDGTPHVLVHYQDQVALDGVYQAHYSKRVAGVWAATVYPYGPAAADDQFGVVGVHFTNLAYALFYGKGYGANPTFKNVAYSEDTGVGWFFPESVTDTANDWIVESILDARNFDVGGHFYGDVLTGLAATILRASGGTPLDFVYSDDVTFDLLPVPTTIPPTTIAPTTIVPVTTTPPTTVPPVAGVTVRAGRMFKRRLRNVVARAWLIDASTEALLDPVFAPQLCTAGLYSETTKLREVAGEADAGGPKFVRFALPDLEPMPGEAYFLRVHLVSASMDDLGTRDFFFGTT